MLFTPIERKSVVLDTNVLVSAFLAHHGNPARVLQLIIEQRIVHRTTETILSELANVLSEKLAVKIADVDAFLSLIRECSTIVAGSGNSGFVLDDPDDDKIIDCAIVSQADYIISGDKHLLKLRRHKGIKIMTPKAFLDL